MFSKNATKIFKIFTADLTLCSKCQIDGEDFVNFCGLLRIYELYKIDNLQMGTTIDLSRCARPGAHLAAMS